MAFSPRQKTIAFEVWAYCETHGWDHTIGEVADAIGRHPAAVGKAIKREGWKTRFRSTERDKWPGTAPYLFATPHHFDNVQEAMKA